ncbi:aminoglycoside phosphotransferase [Streptacidiphilus sp. EB103A]|uniref:aminoglycoside phosphotransferase n=1 Tax=Streptacidiphilus sp. EB103A TaxID=3156275 RepID=UPI003516D55C
MARQRWFRHFPARWSDRVAAQLAAALPLPHDDDRREDAPCASALQAATGASAQRAGAGQEPALPPESPAAEALIMRVAHIGWGQLPDQVRTAVERRVGAPYETAEMTTGESSGIATLLFPPDGAKVFVKGLPVDHERAGELEREARVNPHLPDYAPKLLWHLEAGGWRLLGFEGVTATPWADFTPEGGHLEPVAAVLRELSTRPAPDIELMTAWERWGPYCDPAAEPLLTGRNLLHTDPAATNFLIAGDRTWLVDWAWAARGPGWIDAALWGFRLVLDGNQTPERAAAWARAVPAFAGAPREGVRVLAEAEARSWEDWKAYGAAGIEPIVEAARRWADFWR